MRTNLAARFPLWLALVCVPCLSRADAPKAPGSPTAPATAPATALAADPDPAADDDAPPAEESPFAKLNLKPMPGPAKIPLGHQLTLDLPAGYLFLDAGDAAKFAAALHNTPQANVAGTILKADADWFVEVSYDDDGYVKDDEAGKIDAEEILKSYKDGTEAANEERVKGGGKELHVEGWAEMPRYEKATHHVVWGLVAASETGKSVNFNTRVLGRKGIASLNLIVDPEGLTAAKPFVDQLLAATTFDKGFRYEDFDSKNDKVAEYGLAALIAGGAGLGALKLVKVGLLAKFGAVIFKSVAAFGKAIFLAIAGAFAAIKRFFSGKKKAE